MSAIATERLPAQDHLPAYWFIACQFVARTEEEGFTREPASLVHAKQMGTTLTACGIYAFSWHRLWEVPFTSGVRNRCRRCIRVVTTPSR